MMKLKGGSSLWIGGGLVAFAILVALLAPWIALTDPVMGANLMNADRKSTRLNSSHVSESRMPSSA